MDVGGQSEHSSKGWSDSDPKQADIIGGGQYLLNTDCAPGPGLDVATDTKPLMPKFTASFACLKQSGELMEKGSKHQTTVHPSFK